MFKISALNCNTHSCPFHKEAYVYKAMESVSVIDACDRIHKAANYVLMYVHIWKSREVEVR
jgi:hypothetical protein